MAPFAKGAWAGRLAAQEAAPVLRSGTKAVTLLAFAQAEAWLRELAKVPGLPAMFDPEGP